MPRLSSGKGLPSCCTTTATSGETSGSVPFFSSHDRSNGFVFAIFLTQRDGRQVFNIQNNASFVLSRDDIDGITFVNPPLGGIWTQEHVISAIKRIEKQRRFTIPVKDLLAATPLTVCESYTDR